jgi:hypothetical protein
MKKTLVGLTAAVLAGAAGAGHAADLYAPASLKDGAAFVPAPVWTGFYFGANIGAAWSSVELGRNVYTNNISVCETPPPPRLQLTRWQPQLPLGIRPVMRMRTKMGRDTATRMGTGTTTMMGMDSTITITRSTDTTTGMAAAVMAVAAAVMAAAVMVAAAAVAAVVVAVVVAGPQYAAQLVLGASAEAL